MINQKILKINIFLLLFFLLISGLGFIGFDLFESLFNKQKLNKNNNSYNQQTFDNIHEALKSKDLGDKHSLSYYPDFGSNIFLKSNIFPINGRSNIKTFFCKEQGFLSSYYADRHGFNNDDKIYEKSNIIDVALVGDSYIHGACTNQNSLQQNLSRLRNELSFISFAQGGAGPLLELAYLKEYVSKYKPKLVLWFWVANDLRNLGDEIQTPLRFYMQKDFSQNLYNPINKIKADVVVKNLQNQYREIKFAEKQKEKPQKSNNRMKNFIKSYLPRTRALINSSRLFLDKYKFNITRNNNKLISREDILTRDIPPIEEELMIQAAKEILLEAKNTVNSYGGNFNLVYLGFGGWETKPFISEKYLNTHLNQREFLRVFAKDNEIKFYDLDGDIDKYFKPENHINGHFSDDGYKLLSEIVLKYINKNISN